MKPGTFTQLYVQLVFAVKYRECLLTEKHRAEVFSYVSGIVTNLGHKSLIVNGFSDHVHILFGVNPSISISDTVSNIKKSSSYFINEQNWFTGKFKWQDGYGAFSYCKDQIKRVYEYIKNQEDHHQSNTFRNEFLLFLKEAGIVYDNRFLFEFYNDINK